MTTEREERPEGGEAPLPAGDFARWLRRMEAVLAGHGDSEVPCGDCSACCTSSQFVHIGPGETETLGRLPPELLFPAPRLPRGHVLLGYDARGHCPLVREGRCTVYPHRPRTCRTYDCRIFAAAGVEPGEDRPDIARRARRWRFSFASEDDRTYRAAVRAAGQFLEDRGDVLPEELRPATSTQTAVLALEIHRVFLQEDAAGRPAVIRPSDEEVLAEVIRCRGRPPS